MKANSLRKILPILIPYLLFHNNGACQTSKLFSINSELSLYKPVQFGAPSAVSDFNLSPERTNHESFFDKYCLSIKHMIGFQQEWKKFSYLIGLGYSSSFNNVSYENLKPSTNFYGVYQAKEKFNSFTIDGMINLKIQDIKGPISTSVMLGFEISNMFRYSQFLRAEKMGEEINSVRNEIYNSKNENKFSRINYLLFFRPAVGFNFQWDCKDKLKFSIIPLIRLRSWVNRKYGSEDNFESITFTPYHQGEYRGSVTFSTVLSVGYKF